MVGGDGSVGEGGSVAVFGGPRSLQCFWLMRGYELPVTETAGGARSSVLLALGGACFAAPWQPACGSLWCSTLIAPRDGNFLSDTFGEVLLVTSSRAGGTLRREEFSTPDEKLHSSANSAIRRLSEIRTPVLSRTPNPNNVNSSICSHL